MKKLALIFLCLALLSGCAIGDTPEQKQYTATFISLFDTVTTVVGRAESKEAFEASVEPIRAELERYHHLFDIYNEYEGMANLKTVNDKAAIAPVYVDRAVIDLLLDCKRYYEATGGRFNPAMGSVLSLWHDAREDGLNDPQNAYLPNEDALKDAALHVDPDDIVLDLEHSTVFFKDPKLKLDVGGIAKGWSVQRICQTVQKGLLISVGGNVYATGPKTESGTPWAVGIQDPEGGSNYLHILNIKSGSVVTSGSYHRAYVVNGELYHHIIDPDTLYPSKLWTSVSIICEDSGLADVLSTSLFLMSREEGQKLLDKFDAHAMWVDTNSNKYYSPEFQDLIRN